MLRLNNICIIIYLYPLLSVVSIIHAWVISGLVQFTTTVGDGGTGSVQFSSLGLSEVAVQFSSVHYDYRRWQFSSVQFTTTVGLLK